MIISCRCSQSNADKLSKLAANFLFLHSELKKAENKYETRVEEQKKSDKTQKRSQHLESSVSELLKKEKRVLENLVLRIVNGEDIIRAPRVSEDDRHAYYIYYQFNEWEDMDTGNADLDGAICVIVSGCHPPG